MTRSSDEFDRLSKERTATREVSARGFVRVLKDNVVNNALTDSDFRQFIRESLHDVTVDGPLDLGTTPHSDGVSDRPFGVRDLEERPPRVMYAIGRRDSIEHAEIGMLNGPNPSLEEMLAFDPGTHNDVVVRFTGHGTEEVIRVAFADGRGHYTWVEPTPEPDLYAGIPF